MLYEVITRDTLLGKQLRIRRRSRRHQSAALFAMRMAMRHHGCVPEVELLPDPMDPTLMARIRIGGESAPEDDEERLFAALHHGHVSRVITSYSIHYTKLYEAST